MAIERDLPFLVGLLIVSDIFCFTAAASTFMHLVPLSDLAKSLGVQNQDSGLSFFYLRGGSDFI